MNLNTLKGIVALTLGRWMTGCMGPMPIVPPEECGASHVTRILNEDYETAEYGYLRVHQHGSVQTAYLGFLRPDPRPGEQVYLVIDGNVQGTTVWQGYMIGMRPPVAMGEVVCHNPLYTAEIVFGTLATDRNGSTNPAFSAVGRHLTNRETIELRLDICSSDGCVVGTPKRFVVDLVP